MRARKDARNFRSPAQWREIETLQNLNRGELVALFGLGVHCFWGGYFGIRGIKKKTHTIKEKMKNIIGIESLI